MPTEIAVKKGEETHLSNESKNRARNFSYVVKKGLEIIAEGRAEAAEMLGIVKAKTYGRLGWWVNEHLRAREGKNSDGKPLGYRSPYGQKTIPKFAEKWGMKDDLLWEITRVQAAFPIVGTSQELPYSHYVALTKVHDDKERNRLAREAVQKKWSYRELVKKIGSPLTLPSPRRGEEKGEGSVPKPLPPLKPRRGKFYTYRLVEIENVHLGGTELKVDLGFLTYESLKLTGLKDPKAGDIVEAVRTQKNLSGDRYRFKKSTETKSALYTYAAKITKFHDADTYWLNLDLGFRLSHVEKIRLRGINAKELGDGGEAALEYVKEKLSRVPFVVVTTFWSDKWGRMLIDLFYLEGTDDPEKILREGIYLNQELLDLGLAVWEE